MKRVIALIVAGALFALGALATARGLAWIGGPGVAQDPTLATLGPITLGLAVALVFVIVRRP